MNSPSSVQSSATQKVSRLAKLIAPAFALSALTVPVSAATNLVKNGGFESNGGPGATQYGSYRITLDDWIMSPTGFMGLDTYANANINTSEPIQFWGAAPGYKNGNGFTGSPDGGYFWAADGHSGFRGTLEQEITGLTVGGKYDLSFYYAHGQEACGPCNGATRQAWQVYLGAEQYNTPFVDLPEHGFMGWFTATHTFTANATTEILQFWADGGTGAPPMALLDGVRLTAHNQPPTPAPGPLPIVGLGVSLAWSGRLRKRVKQANRN